MTGTTQATVLKTMIMSFELPTPIGGFLIGVLFYAVIQFLASLYVYLTESNGQFETKNIWKYYVIYGFIFSFTATMIEYYK